MEVHPVCIPHFSLGMDWAGRWITVAGPPPRQAVLSGLALWETRKQEEFLTNSPVFRCFGDKGDVEDITEGEFSSAKHLQHLWRNRQPFRILAHAL